MHPNYIFQTKKNSKNKRQKTDKEQEKRWGRKKGPTITSTKTSFSIFFSLTLGKHKQTTKKKKDKKSNKESLFFLQISFQFITDSHFIENNSNSQIKSRFFRAICLISNFILDLIVIWMELMLFLHSCLQLQIFQIFFFLQCAPAYHD